MAIFGQGKSPKITYPLLLDLEKYVAMGLSKAEIAKVIGVDARTLRRWVSNGRKKKGDIRYQHVAAIFEGKEWQQTRQEAPQRTKKPRRFDQVLLDIVRRRKEDPGETSMTRMSEIGDGEINFTYDEAGNMVGVFKGDWPGLEAKQKKPPRVVTPDYTAVGERWLKEKEDTE